MVEYSVTREKKCDVPVVDTVKSEKLSEIVCMFEKAECKSVDACKKYEVVSRCAEMVYEHEMAGVYTLVVVVSPTRYLCERAHSPSGSDVIHVKPHVVIVT